MAKKLEPTKSISWSVYKIAAKAVQLSEVEAPDEATAMEGDGEDRSGFEGAS